MFKYAALALRQLRGQCQMESSKEDFFFLLFERTTLNIWFWCPFPAGCRLFFLSFITPEAARCGVPLPALLAACLLPAPAPRSQTSCWVIQSTENPCCRSVTGYVRILKVHPLAFKVFQVFKKKLQACWVFLPGPFMYKKVGSLVTLCSALPKGEWPHSFCCVDQWFHIKKKQRAAPLVLLGNFGMNLWSDLDLQQIDRSQAF